MTCDFTEYSRSFSKEEVNSLPLFRYEGPVTVVRDRGGLLDALEFMREEYLLGFDTESRPCFRKGVTSTPSLVQIACSDRVFLIQLRQIPLGEDLAALLGDSGCIKAGVAIRDDMRLLARLFPFTGAGLVDLGEVARSNGLTTRGLRTLAANFLGIRVSKGAQCSNWEHKDLSQQQILYAATDAWISRQVYERMSELGFFAEPALCI